MNKDLVNLDAWSKKWLMQFAPHKTKALTVSNKSKRDEHPHLKLDGVIIEEVKSFVYLGLTFSYNLRWNVHIDSISTKSRKRLSAMMPLKFKLSRGTLETMFKSFVMPILEYGITVWGGSYDSDILKLERIQIDALRLITGAPARSNIATLYQETGFDKFKDRIENRSVVMLYKIKNDLAPDYLYELLPTVHNAARYNLRNNHNIKVPFTRLEVFKRSFIPRSIHLWNSLTLNVRNKESLFSFKSAIFDNDKCNILYYYGQRWPAVHHARLRMGCSKLNADLCLKLHVIESSSCDCGNELENSFHFFFDCPRFVNQRQTLFQTVRQYSHITHDILLHGNPTLNFIENTAIFSAIHKFIEECKRF